MAATTTSNTECQALSTCDSDTQFEATEPSPAADRECSPFTVCTDSEFTAGRTALCDLDCQALRVCDADTHYESLAPTDETDRLCAATIVCTATQDFNGVGAAATCTTQAYTGRRVLAGAEERRLDDGVQHWNSCEDNQYISSGSTHDSNNQPVCMAVSECDAIWQYESVAPTSTSNRECTVVSVCDFSSQYEETATTSTSDRDCAPISTCTDEQYRTAQPTSTTDRECVPASTCSTSS